MNMTTRAKLRSRSKTKNFFFSLRKAKKSDLEFIVGSQLLMAIETEGLKLNQGLLKKGVSRILKANPYGYYLIAECKEIPVAACLILKEWSDWRAREVLWLHSLYVLPEYRRHGVFKKMYLELMNEIKASERLGGLRLYVDKRNKKAQKVYRNLGFDGQHYQMFEKMKS